MYISLAYVIRRIKKTSAFSFSTGSKFALFLVSDRGWFLHQLNSFMFSVRVVYYDLRLQCCATIGLLMEDILLAAYQW